MFGRSCFPAASLVLALISFTASPSHGQSFVAAEAGAVRLRDEYESVSFFEVGLRFGSLRPKRVNGEGRIATFPEALSAGVIVLAADIDAAYVLPLAKGIDATPRAGISLVAGASSEGAGGAPGVNFGFGVVAGVTSPVGARFDYSRTYLGLGEGTGASTFSIGIVWVH